VHPAVGCGGWHLVTRSLVAGYERLFCLTALNARLRLVVTRTQARCTEGFGARSFTGRILRRTTRHARGGGICKPKLASSDHSITRERSTKQRPKDGCGQSELHVELRYCVVTIWYYRKTSRWTSVPPVDRTQWASVQRKLDKASIEEAFVTILGRMRWSTAWGMRLATLIEG